MSLDVTPESQEPITSVAPLLERFRKAEKPPGQFRVGLEVETLGVDRRTMQAVPYDGPRGIAAVLEGLARRRGLERWHEDGALVALLAPAAKITLEPGGQVELSGAPHTSLRAMCEELGHHLTSLHEVARPLGIRWLAAGYRPFGRVADMPWVPKLRYRPMRAYLPGRGALALDMMLMTASVQASFDWCDEADMAEKFAAAVGCSPIVAAAYANSPIVDGRESGYLSYRYHVWRDVDPDRCGLLDKALAPGWGYQAYLDWALDAPLIFCRRGGQYHTVGVPFRQLIRDGLLGAPPTMTDFEDHLTTLFPEVRLKSVIEIRGADAVNAPLSTALPALWTGLLYDHDARRAALETARRIAPEDRPALVEAAARHGLQGSVGRVKLVELAVELCRHAQGALSRAGNTEAQRLLEPLVAQVTSGRSPGHDALDAWRASGGDAVRYARALRY